MLKKQRLNHMKRVPLIIAGICLATSLTVRAADDKTTPEKPATDKPVAKEHHLTNEQKAFLKEITAKYDANKDGKLDKEERQKISADDKERMKKAGLGPKGGPKAHAKVSKDADSTK